MNNSSGNAVQKINHGEATHADDLHLDDWETDLNFSYVKRVIPVHLQPGCVVSGSYRQTDHSQGMLILELSTGERALMSIYEIPNQVFENRFYRASITGTVDRVEFDESHTMTVIVKGDEFHPLY